MKKYILHLVLILSHKYYVSVECFKMGLFWQGLTHDLSKFSMIEFLESAKYFTGTKSPIDGAKKDKGFSKAWLHHKGINRHHWQYWIDFKGKEPVPIDIPEKYIKEMICDIRGASKAYLKKSYTKDSPLFYLEKNIDNWIITEKVYKRLNELI